MINPQLYGGCYFQLRIEVFLGIFRTKKIEVFNPFESTGVPHPQFVRFNTEGRQCENTGRRLLSTCQRKRHETPFPEGPQKEETLLTA